MQRLKGKVAVITGGASGIGAATVRMFVAEGAKVVVADIQDELGEALAAELGDAAIYQNTDVTDESAVKASVDRAAADFGGLDCIYNNAGGFAARGSILEIEVAAFDKALALLLRSVFLGMKHAGAVMAEQGHGSIISTSSIAGILPGGGPHIYATAKAAVVHLSKSVALELGERDVRVNCICPGGVVTPLVLGAFDAGEDAAPMFEEGMRHTKPMSRAGQPEDIARAAVWLASDDSEYVTGQAIAVDGGEATGILWAKQALK